MNALKERLDVLLVQKGYFETREKAKRSIMAGIVFADGIRLDKAGMRVDTDAEIEVRGKICPYVSRGGLKLEKSITEFDLDQRDRPRQKVQGIRNLLGPGHPDQRDVGVGLAAQIPHLRQMGNA